MVEEKKNRALADALRADVLVLDGAMGTPPPGLLERAEGRINFDIRSEAGGFHSYGDPSQGARCPDPA